MLSATGISLVSGQSRQARRLESVEGRGGRWKLLLGCCSLVFFPVQEQSKLTTERGTLAFFPFPDSWLLFDDDTTATDN